MHPELHMTRQVYDQICNTIGRRPPESGGILGSSDGGKTIDRFYFDATAKVTGGTYSPDTEVINRVLAHWDAQDILLGTGHSAGRLCPFPPERLCQALGGRLPLCQSDHVDP